jgi:hypothetical protein
VRDVDELVPTRGCSVPTFHGSAADMAAVAASLTSLLGSHVSATVPVSGTHLIALPHSPVGPFHRFIQPDRARQGRGLADAPVNSATASCNRRPVELDNVR